MVRAPHPHCRGPRFTLVRELRSHKLSGMAPQKNPKTHKQTKTSKRQEGRGQEVVDLLLRIREHRGPSGVFRCHRLAEVSKPTEQLKPWETDPDLSQP